MSLHPQPIIVQEPKDFKMVPRIMGAIKGKENILVWTDNALYSMKFVGAPFTFGFEQVGTNCGYWVRMHVVK